MTYSCSHTRPDQLTLTEHLARERTMLANERTLLSYWRTGLGLIAGGGTLLKLFPEDRALWVTGIVLIVLGTCATTVGTLRFTRVNRRLRLSDAVAPVGGEQGSSAGT